MKLVWAIVQAEDASDAVKALVTRGYRTTRINTVGGWLR
ncbi:MAG: cyclic-di-AMP receptor, partial [Chloroflexota bacterium]